MKKIIIFAILMNFLGLYAQDSEKIDITKKPDALAKINFVFPEYQTITLKNGLKVFIIEDHEQPTISMRMMIAGGTSMDNGKFGVSEMTADMLERGAGKRSALEIAQQLDGVGAKISASSSADFINVSASSLKKHSKLLLEIFSDMITNPSFDGDEFDKLQPQYLSALKEAKSNSGQIAAGVSRKAVFGTDHPYAGKQNETIIKDMRVKDLKNYYKTYFIPNNATLAVVGDITENEIRPLLENAFKNWDKKEDIKIALPETKSLPLGVYYIARPGSVQSSVNIAVKAIPYNHPDYETLDIASSVIGSGFAGRLFRTLRETYSYTYTPFGSVTGAKFINRFTCGADVRNSVTDSAINVTLEQLALLASTPPSEEELDRIKKFEVGQYMSSFENSDFIASLIQSADFQNISLNSLKTYPERIMAISPSEIKRVANEYMNPKKAYIVVVGAPEVKEKLANFGKLYEYDLDLNPTTGEKGKFEKAGIDAEELIEKHTNAIGGKANIAKVTSLINNGTAEMALQGKNLKGTMIQKSKSSDKMKIDFDMGIFKSTVLVKGKEAFTGSGTEVEKQEGLEAQKLLFSAVLFKETKFKELGYKMEILGKQGNEIVAKVTGPQAHEMTYYFDAVKFLINKVETLENMPSGPTPVTESFSNYELVDGLVMMPKKTVNENPMFVINLTNNYKLNQEIDDKEF
jgi:predicted Zn-dependent peptidase